MRRTFGFNRRRRAASARGYGHCKRCGTGWHKAESHSTPYEWDRYTQLDGGVRHFESRAMSPLCEPCWTELGAPDERLPYYVQLVDEWRRMGSPNQPSRDRLRLALRVEAGQATFAEGMPV